MSEIIHARLRVVSTDPGENTIIVAAIDGGAETITIPFRDFLKAETQENAVQGHDRDLIGIAEAWNWFWRDETDDARDAERRRAIAAANIAYLFWASGSDGDQWSVKVVGGGTPKPKDQPARAACFTFASEQEASAYFPVIVGDDEEREQGDE